MGWAGRGVAHSWGRGGRGQSLRTGSQQLVGGPHSCRQTHQASCRVLGLHEVRAKLRPGLAAPRWARVTAAGWRAPEGSACPRSAR